jgi:hypothetical protein
MNLTLRNMPDYRFWCFSDAFTSVLAYVGQIFCVHATAPIINIATIINLLFMVRGYVKLA